MHIIYNAKGQMKNMNNACLYFLCPSVNNYSEREDLSMLRRVEYNRKAAVEYAQRWALSRNPEFYSFEGMGGDCTKLDS